VNSFMFLLLKRAILVWLLTAAGILLARFFFGRRIRMRGFVSPLLMALSLLPFYLFTPEILRILQLPVDQGMQLVFTIMVATILLFTLAQVMPQTQIEHFGVAVAWSTLLNLFLLFCGNLYAPLALFTGG
jgi:uncharacterized membrane protein YvlD (DUF360 family)